MRKLFMIAMAALAITFASCTDSAQKGDDAAYIVENLQKELAEGDGSAIQKTLETAKAKISELVAKDPEAAKTYITKVQDFLKENGEKISALVGDNAVAQGIVTTLVNAPADVVVQTLTAGQNAFDSAKASVAETADSLKQAAQDKAAEKIDEATEKVNEKIDEAAEKAAEAVKDGADKLLKGAGLK